MKLLIVPFFATVLTAFVGACFLVGYAYPGVIAGLFCSWMGLRFCFALFVRI